MNPDPAYQTLRDTLQLASFCFALVLGVGLGLLALFLAGEWILRHLDAWGA